MLHAIESDSTCIIGQYDSDTGKLDVFLSDYDHGDGSPYYRGIDVPDLATAERIYNHIVWSNML